MKLIRSSEGKYYEGWFFFHHKTDKAVLVSENGRSEDATWVPLSQCINEPIPILEGEHPEVELCIPEWLAAEKEFI